MLKISLLTPLDLNVAHCKTVITKSFYEQCLLDNINLLFFYCIYYWTLIVDIMFRVLESAYAKNPFYFFTRTPFPIKLSTRRKRNWMQKTRLQSVKGSFYTNYQSLTKNCLSDKNYCRGKFCSGKIFVGKRAEIFENNCHFFPMNFSPISYS